jgi:DNA helicase II / ATP-dependent DNA helicase PcrA
MENAISQIFEGLNSAQNEAVGNIDGPSLIIAGAGSGKTRVLTCKIANIIGHGTRPDKILALTFTNKASREMKERIGKVVGARDAYRLWMGTFHSIFARFLREEAELIGFPKSFTIYDTSDSRSLIKSCIKELQLDDKIYKPNEVHSRISKAKNNLVTAAAYSASSTLQQSDAAANKPRVHEIYSLYYKRCRQAGAMDFDDLLLYANILFRDFPDALERIRERFNYILVDEFQDTNLSQYLILKKLCSEHKNITVVGDDAQSIYSFRGARIENILNFKKDFPEAKEYKLEQNYRSTRTIVEAANSLININKMQLKKNCFSEHEKGEPIELIKAFTEQEEGFMIASSIIDTVYKEKASYGDFAILYRTNAQSRVIEEALRRKNLPYKIFAGHSFYDRAEVKDLLAYFRLVMNIKDDESFLRVINFPARGIGDTSIGRVKEWARDKELSLSEVIVNEDYAKYGLKPAVVMKIRSFVGSIEKLRENISLMNAYEMALEIDKCFGISAFLKQDTSLEGQSKVENAEELYNSIKEFVEEGEAENELLMSDSSEEAKIEAIENSSLSANQQDGLQENSGTLISMDLYLQNVSLISDLDTKGGEEDTDKISLMTVHSSKGLEFPFVYVAGMEENLFPSLNSNSSEGEIEEERRLFYVAMTRAEKFVKFSFSHSRMRWGTHVNNSPSRFIKEIDKRYISNPIEEDNLLTKASLPGNTSSAIKESFRRSVPVAERFKPISHTQQSVPRQPRDSNFVADSPSKMKVGQNIEHERFGKGVILSLEGSGTEMKAIVRFYECGEKTLLLKFAKIRILIEN